MADKTIKTRILLKIDTLENWQKSTLGLKKGEVAFATASASVGTGLAEPVVMLKVGQDGVKTFKDLPWSFYAKASDVLAVCKDEASLKQFINGVINDAGIATDEALNAVKTDVVSLKTLVGDTAVATQISNAIAALKLADNYEIKGSAEAVKVALLGDAAAEYNTLGKLEDAVIAAQTSADEKTTMAAVEAKDYATKTEAQGYATAVVGVAADTADKDTVKGAKKYADSLNTAMDTRVDALEAAIGEGGSVADTIATEIGKLDVPEVAVGTGEIIEKISETDGKIAVSKRALVAGDIPDLAITQITGLQTALDGKQATIAWQSDNYDASTNKAITKSDLDTAVAGLSGAVHFIGVKESLPTTGSNGDIVIVGNKEYVYSDSDTKWHELGDETIYAVKGEIVDANIKADAAIAQSKIAGLTDALAEKANTADLGTMASETATNYIKKTEAVGYDDILTATVAGTTYETKNDASAKLASAKEYTNTELGKLVLMEVSAGEGQIIDKISQANGKVSASTRALVAADIPTLTIDKITGLQTALDAKAADDDLAAIAKSGSIMDLVQNTGDVLIFDCGNSVE